MVHKMPSKWSYSCVKVLTYPHLNLKLGFANVDLYVLMIDVVLLLLTNLGKLIQSSRGSYIAILLFVI